MARIRSSSIPGKVYKYVHHEDVYVKTNLSGRAFQEKWLRIDEDGTLTVLAGQPGGYAWDGCSPKWNILDFIVGTPDGRLDLTTERQITYYASMIHDVLYQYKGKVSLSRKEADILFRLNLIKAKFLLNTLYFLGVRIGGGFYGKWLKLESVSEIKIEKWSWLKL
jgi:hypothetical protein